jgi:integrase
VLRQHILPVFGDRPINRVAHNLPEFRQFLLVTLPAKGVSKSTVHTAKMIITGTIRDAIATGRLRQSQGAIIFGKGVRIPKVPTRAGVYFASYGELKTLADGLGEPYGLLVWIMLGTGIRLGEALAVKREDFKDGVLRISDAVHCPAEIRPLKHRQAGQFRDVPYPSYLESMLPDVKGYIFKEPPNRGTLMRKFYKGRDAAGLPKSFTWHSLRHIFVSVTLSEGVPITDVSRWLVMRRSTPRLRSTGTWCRVRSLKHGPHWTRNTRRGGMTHDDWP